VSTRSRTSEEFATERLKQFCMMSKECDSITTRK
jgi:hypothetical protein